MSHLEDDHAINCPYCGTSFSVRVDNTAGPRQAFILDCENCCRPIEIEATTEDDGYVNLIVKRQGEG